MFLVEKKEGQLPEERKRVTEKCRSIVETNRETGYGNRGSKKACRRRSKMNWSRKKIRARHFGAIERSTDLCSAGRGVRVFLLHEIQ